VSLSEQELLEKAEELKKLLVMRATEGGGDDSEYQVLRRALLSEPRVNDKLPLFLKSCRTLSEFWGFIKSQSPKWAERREILRSVFDPLLTALETGLGTPADDAVSAKLSTINADNVRRAWSTALERRTRDPEGAITMAKTLLEHVCKHILDERGTSYTDKDDLPKLYHKVAEQLNLAPSQHTEETFRKILGATQTIVNGLGELRNSLSDAHGKGKLAANPSLRHAELAVNLAGTMATFLVATWETKKDNPVKPTNEEP
jgi:hypothetical protein